MASEGLVSHLCARTPHAPPGGRADLWRLICILGRRPKILESLSLLSLHPSNRPNSNTEAGIPPGGGSLLLTTNASQ